jgi:L-ascorbate metabolism protein UlaG (beta-lactamase superfamily)
MPVFDWARRRNLCRNLGDSVSGIASAHEALERDERGRAKYLGYILQFGDWTIYHSGDTVRYEGMSEKLQHFRVDVALLPINGRAAERRVPGNLFGREAAQLASDIGAKLVIPCHFDMFEFNTARRTNLPTIARSWDSHTKCYAAAKNGRASP